MKTKHKRELRTFGCQMNDADSQVMETLLEKEGVADFSRVKKVVDAGSSLRLEKE